MTDASGSTLHFTFEHHFLVTPSERLGKALPQGDTPLLTCIIEIRAAVRDGAPLHVSRNSETLELKTTRDMHVSVHKRCDRNYYIPCLLELVRYYLVKQMSVKKCKKSTVPWKYCKECIRYVLEKMY